MDKMNNMQNDSLLNYVKGLRDGYKINSYGLISTSKESETISIQYHQELVIGILDNIISMAK